MDTRTQIELLIGVVGAAFAAFFVMDARHAHDEEVHAMVGRLTEEVIMREAAVKSEYAAQAKKYYRDLEDEGVELRDADKLRIEMLDRQQQRAHDILMGREE